MGFKLCNQYGSFRYLLAEKWFCGESSLIHGCHFLKFNRFLAVELFFWMLLALCCFWLCVVSVPNLFSVGNE